VQSALKFSAVFGTRWLYSWNLASVVAWHRPPPTEGMLSFAHLMHGIISAPVAHRLQTHMRSHIHIGTPNSADALATDGDDHEHNRVGRILTLAERIVLNVSVGLLLVG
jgi:hypothetical protein